MLRLALKKITFLERVHVLFEKYKHPKEIQDLVRRVYGQVQAYSHSKRFSIRARQSLSILVIIVVAPIVLLFGYALILGLNRLFAFLNVTPRIGAIDVPTLVTLLVVEGMFEILHRIFGGSDKPKVQVWNEARIGRTTARSNVVYWGLSVSNRGREGAMQCQAQLTLRVKKEDIITLPKTKMMITKSRFRPIYEHPIKWVHQDSENFDLRPDKTRMEPLLFLRVVPKHGRVPLHFEIPSRKGWKPLLTALKADDYEGKIKVSPMNGKPDSQTFLLEYDPKTKQAQLIFPSLVFPVRSSLEVT